MLDVRAGDVLLFRGNGFISKGIRFLDGSEVNHAAIALSGTELAEAVGHGLDTAAIASTVEKNERTIVRRPIDCDSDLAVAVARRYLDSGTPYAYQQILLLAALCLTRRIPIRNRLFRRVLRRALDSAANLVNSLVDRGVDLMICSEYVYRCYGEAGCNLLPAGIPEAVAVGPGSAEDVVLLDWLDGAPQTPVAATPRSPSADPSSIAEAAEYELENLLAAFFADSEGESVVPISAADEGADVTDAEIAQAAVGFGSAAVRLDRLRHPEAVGLAPADALAFLRGMLSTDADFVTPKDLLLTARLQETSRTG